MRPSPALAAAVLSLSLLTACGGGDGGGGGGGDEADTGGGDALSKADFISQGDAVCAALEAAGETITPPAAEDDFGRFIREAVAAARGAREDFAALTPPEDGEQVKQALLDALDTSIETAEGAATAAEGGDTVSAGDLLEQASQEGDAADQEARDYGFQECGTEQDDAAAGEDTSGGDSAGAKEDFIAAGDAVCSELAASTAAVAEPADETDLARYLDEVLPLAAEAREAFAALTPPADGVAVQEELLASLDASLEAGSAASAAAAQGDSVTASDLLTQAAADGAEANASAQAYGFQQCGADAG